MFSRLPDERSGRSPIHRPTPPCRLPILMTSMTHVRSRVFFGALFALALSGGTAPHLSAQIPTPESVLGQRVGADFFLATFEESIEYFQQLDAASDRLELRQVGVSSFGRPIYIALISSPENLSNVERHKEIALRLAHPDGLTDQEARALADEGKAIVHIDGGLHASEVAHAQHTIQLAYDLVTGDADPEIAAILDNVILMLWPSINPDGQTMIAEWYRSNLGTQYEVAPAPFLYQKYIGHDNNRDGYMINQIESRMVTRVAREWEPQILYNHHQTSPFPTRIWIPPFAEPISPYRPSAHVPDGEPDRHGHVPGARGAWPEGRHAHGHRVRQLVSGVHGPRPQLPQRGLPAHGNGTVPLRDTAFLHDPGLPAADARPAAGVDVFQPLGRRVGGGFGTRSTTC